MRKDVKIGLGIGGVLLAVLIVYLLVPKNDPTLVARNDDGASVEQHGDGGVTPGPTGASAGGDRTDAGESSGGADQDAGGAAPATADRGAGNEVAGADTADDTTSGTTHSIDWEKILVTGIVPEARIPAMAPTGPGATEDIFGDQQKATPPANTGAEPDWSTAARVAPTTPAAPPRQDPATPPAATGGANGATAGGYGANGPAATRDHVIQQNETLSMIASVAYGDARRYKEILKANPGLDERRLRPGMVIKLPDASSLPAAQATAQTAAARQEVKIDPASEYRVGQGDSLHKIAVKLYGKAAKADAIYQANKDKIGEEPSRLKLGMVLKLPEPPASAQSAR